jgi:hypothetical protein
MENLIPIETIAFTHPIQNPSYPTPNPHPTPPCAGAVPVLGRPPSSRLAGGEPAATSPSCLLTPRPLFKTRQRRLGQVQSPVAESDAAACRPSPCAGGRADTATLSNFTGHSGHGGHGGGSRNSGGPGCPWLPRSRRGRQRRDACCTLRPRTRTPSRPRRRQRRRRRRRRRGFCSYSRRRMRPKSACQRGVFSCVPARPLAC